MNAADYQKVKEIFHLVLEIEPASRSAFLDEKCAGDGALRGEVERLLGSYDSEFLEQPAVAKVADEFAGNGLGTGQQIGRYTIIKSIGKGGMGEVYLAEDSRLARQVALKVLPEDFVSDSERLRRFEQEARAASALNHPNILTIFEFAEDGKMHFLVAEFVGGQTLRQVMNGGALSVNDSLDIAIQVVAALDAAHRNGIIHRDIKPENIMLRDDGLVKVLDFGLAKFIDQASKDDGSTESPTRKQLTTPGTIMGTVQYMSPEQTRGNPTDARTDIWSLGCVTYEMLAGKPPFAGENSADLIAEIVKTHPAPLSHSVSDVPERLDEIVAKTLEKNPDERYQTAKDLLIDLKRMKRKLDLETEIERSHSPATQGSKLANAAQTVSDINSPAIQTQTISSAEFVFSEIKGHKRTAAGVLVLLLAVVGASAYFALTYSRGSDPNKARIDYANKIKLAAQALDSSNLPLVKQSLDETRPKDGEEDLRGFEWGYLAHQLAERMASQPITLKNEGRVNSVAFSADSKTLATGSDDARLWDVSTGQQTALFKGHSKPVVSVAISPDGTKLATGSDDKTARLWDISSGQTLWKPIASTGNNIGRLAFSRDGNTLSGEDDHKIKVWDIATGKETNPYVKFGDIGHPFVVSPDGKFLAAQGPIFIMSVFDIASGRRIASMDSKVGFVTDVKFAPDSKSILIAGTWDSDNTAKLWSLPEGKEIRPFDDITGAIAFSPNGKLIATANRETIKLWDAEKGHEIASLPGHADRVVAVAFSPDGLKLASGSLDNTTKIWNVPKNESRGIVRAHAKSIGSLTFSPDGKTIVSASGDKTAKLWDVETEQERRAISSHTEKVITTAFSPDGLTLATAGDDLTIKLWDVVTGRQRHSIESLKPATVLTFSPDGKLLASGHWWHDLGVRLWDTASGTLSCSADTRGNGDWSVEFSKDGKQFIAATPPGDNEPSEDNAIRFWEAASCREISPPIHGEPGTAFGVVYVGGELRALQILNNGRSGKLLELESRKELASFGGHESETRGHAFSPDGKRLFTSDMDGRIKIWDVATGQELLSLKVNAGEAGSLAFSPKGNVLAAAGDSGIIRFWRSQSFSE